jgi:hypothetical protein
MLALAVALLGAGSSAAMAQQTSKQSSKPQATQNTAKRAVTMREQTPGLLAQAKISADSATKLASAKLPSEKVVREEIRQDGGKLVYSFSFKDAAKPGVDVVHVDATNGTVSDAKHMDRTGRGKHHSDSTKTSTKSST